MNKTITYSLDEIPRIATDIKKLLKDSPVITFTGPLGAGKTTLVKELLKQCGVTDMVTSPTFTYMNQYVAADDTIFYHFDLYRISDINQFLEAGFDEYLYQPNCLTLIEWPEHIMPLLRERACHVAIDYDGEQRKLTIS
jgi:tRNA threonylcarbamoyladenosine biosynthesis protein TsaE